MLKKSLIIFLFSFSSLVCARDMPPLLSLGGGVFDHSHARWMAQIEYKWSIPSLYLRPQVGMLTADLNCVYTYFGLGLEVFLKERLIFTPSFSPGLYFRGAHAKRLGNVFEFRSCLEFAYLFKNCTRLGCQLFHISNASIGRHNPGVNCLVVVFEIPLRFSTPPSRWKG